MLPAVSRLPIKIREEAERIQSPDHLLQIPVVHDRPSESQPEKCVDRKPAIRVHHLKCLAFFVGICHQGKEGCIWLIRDGQYIQDKGPSGYWSVFLSSSSLLGSCYLKIHLAVIPLNISQLQIRFYHKKGRLRQLQTNNNSTGCDMQTGVRRLQRCKQRFQTGLSPGYLRFPVMKIPEYT